MSITLITSLLLVGYLNTRNANAPIGSATIKIQQKTLAQITTSPFNPAFNNIHTESIAASSTFSEKNIEASTMSNSAEENSANDINEKITSFLPMPAKNSTFKLNINHDLVTDKENLNSTLTDIGTSTGSKKEVTDSESFNEELADVSADLNPTNMLVDESGVLTYTDKAPITYFINNNSIGDFGKANTTENLTHFNQGGNLSIEQHIFAGTNTKFISADEKNWIENYALYNKPAAKKWANKLAFQVYATPSVVYRKLSNQPAGNSITATPFAISTASQGINSAVNQKPSLGLEVGTGIQYSILKGVILKAGLQLNFTRYNADAFQNSHPVTTMLTMHDFKTNTLYQVSRATPYSSKSGLESVRLHNETFQISLPLGAEIRVIGNDILQWNIGATIQPTFVAGGKSYLISSDRLNYVKETSMLNRWNLNAGLETNITYKAKGLSYQIGPQFRTQLFSTNSRNYAVEERLINFGLKFGVSKIIK